MEDENWQEKSDSFSTTNSRGSKSQIRHKFSAEEDKKLNKLIAIHGPRKWDQIALSMPGRTGRQCRDRFHNYLKPSLTNGPWLKEEDILLEKKVNELGQHWNKISKYFKGRSANNIKNRWYTYVYKQNRQTFNPAAILQQIGPFNKQYDTYNDSFNDVRNDNINVICCTTTNTTGCSSNEENNIISNTDKKKQKIIFPPIMPPQDKGLIFPNTDFFGFIADDPGPLAMCESKLRIRI